jgi:hypothetical protein
MGDTQLMLPKAKYGPCKEALKSQRGLTPIGGNHRNEMEGERV